MEVKIKSDTVSVDTSKMITIKNIVNLSSMQTSYLKTMLNQLTGSSKQFHVMKIIALVMYIDSERKNRVVKPTAVWFVVDEDDKLNDIKIRNISRINNYVKVGKIVLIKEESKVMKISMTGKELRLTTYQVMTETAKQLGCHKKLKMDGKVKEVNIVQLQNKLLGSIAGITLMLNRLELPFTISRNGFEKFASWAVLKPEDLNKVKEGKYVGDDKKLQDPSWMYTIEGTQYIITENKVRTFSTGVEQEEIANDGTESQKKAQDITEILKDILLTVCKKMIETINKVVQKIEELCSLCYIYLIRVFR